MNGSVSCQLPLHPTSCGFFKVVVPKLDHLLIKIYCRLPVNFLPKGFGFHDTSPTFDSYFSLKFRIIWTKIQNHLFISLENIFLFPEAESLGLALIVKIVRSYFSFAEHYFRLLLIDRNSLLILILHFLYLIFYIISWRIIYLFLSLNWLF